MFSRFVSGAVAVLALTSPLSLAGQRTPDRQAPSDQSVEALVNTVSVRSVGPAVMSGRVEDIAVAEVGGAGSASLGTVFYIGSAGGGVWKTTNRGVTWEPIFDDTGVASIGAVAVAPSDPDVVWVGTGEDNNLRSSSYGNGVYRSVDGGESFQHMGLRSSQHIGKIKVHPGNSDIVYVAAVGPLWGAGGDRGVFRTMDGGRTWQNVLSLDEHTGAADIVLDPSDPDVIYAASHQRERRAYSYVGGGPGSGVWKSTDGGDTWTKSTHGLPTSDMGRIGLDVSRSQPRTVYAVVEGSEQGVYRSDNGGASWRKTSDVASIPWYFGEIRVDPVDPETVYHLGVRLQRSTDGGVTWEAIARSVHADQHALWINPENRDHLILGNDGGLYVSHDRGESWDFSPNLPISQFYAVGIDMAEPFFGLYGGLQDNSTWGGPSRTRSSEGIFNADWFRMAGGDGFYAAVDPTDPNVAYVESQNGNILRYDRRTGDRKGIRPIPPEGEPPYRFNWSAPIKISPWDHRTVYFAANHLFKSTDRGDSWVRLGEDLTRALDRDALPMMGGVPAKDAVSRHQGTADFGNVSDIDVSTVREGLLITGSDDGTIAISDDDGGSWTKQTRFPGVPDTTYVSKVRLSRHDAAVMYATFDGHRSNDLRPYVIRSDDGGRTWRNITANLPEVGNVRALAEHHVNPDLLFVGTEFGVFTSLDRGGSWIRITGGMPPVRVDDIVIHPRENTLVVATHGRGFYLVDDLGPLQHLTAARASGGVHLFPVKSEMAFTPDPSRTSGTGADRDYAARNPDVGTTVSYLLPGAGRDVVLEITDAAGAVVRRLDAPDAAGLHHVRWDFRMDMPYAGPPEERRSGQGGGGGFGGGSVRGAMVVPGTYTARLTVEGAPVLEESFAVRKDLQVLLTDAQLRELHGIRMHQLQLDARFSMALRQAEALKGEFDQAREAMKGSSVSDALAGVAAELSDDLDAALRVLRGSGRGGFGGDEAGPRNVRQLLGVAAGVHRATVMPTAQEREALAAVPALLDAQVAAVNEMVAERMPAFLRSLDEEGVPWTPGRVVR
ncbi:MAG: glycosyl hydrolase [Gemmatimonadota bacterium]|nr:glycosyl hydrolase [Gemmatimonadota bacterium]